MSKALEVMELVDTSKDENKSYVFVGKAEELLMMVMDEKITTQLLGDLEALGKGEIETDGKRRDISTRAKAIAALTNIRPDTGTGKFADTTIDLINGMSDAEYNTIYRNYVMNNLDPAPALIPPVTDKTPTDLSKIAPDQAHGDNVEYEVEYPDTPTPPGWIGRSNED